MTTTGMDGAIIGYPHREQIWRFGKRVGEAIAVPE
jgi:hypothetical protein